MQLLRDFVLRKRSDFGRRYEFSGNPAENRGFNFENREGRRRIDEFGIRTRSTGPKRISDNHRLLTDRHRSRKRRYYANGIGK